MRKLGKVLEVFLKEEEQLTKIGFKIEIDNEIITIITKQNLDNVKIYRDDFVYVEIKKLNNEIYYDIELINDNDIGAEDYE